VVLDGSGLSSADMQHFAHWTNLSETTFLLAPSDSAAAQGADYQVRIFTPGGELPFAGHPTLGTCHAWLQAGGQAKSAEFIVQECAQGLVRIRRDATRLAFAAPPLQRGLPDAKLLAEVTAALGLAPQHILASQLLNNGPHWLGLLLDDQEVLLALEPDHNALRHLEKKVGVTHINSGLTATSLIARSNREARAFGPRTGTPAAPTGLARAEVRAFAAPVGVNEDPVTGSLNASLAQWLMADGLAPTSYIATQGTRLGRHGQVFVSQDAQGQVWVGGDVVTCVDGVVML
jgi:PhzF family phenazine biosynthesis protein